MASILDLPDDCLIKILKKLDQNDQYSWSDVCKRFEHIYIRYSHNWMEVNDNLAKNYGHLIGTDDFPLRSIKRLYLTESNCTKNFLNKLRECHKEIEEVALFSFTDEYLAELMPLPNLKKLMLYGSHLRGGSLLELDSLTELHIHTDKFFDPEIMLQITYYNPLRTLVMPNEPQMFSNRYAFEMFENLKNVERLVTRFNPCKSWQLVGTLPKLKKLEILDFVSDDCETCLEDDNLYEICAGQHATIFFDELRRRNQLEELAFFSAYVSDQHLLRIVELTNLKRLQFFQVVLFEFQELQELSVFKDLVNLEELHLLDCSDIYAEPLLELIRCCKKLKVLLLKNVDGVTADFLTEANDILSRRQPTPLKPLTMEFAGDDEHLKLKQFEKPLPFLRFVRMSWSLIEDDLTDLTEEDYVVHVYFSNDIEKGSIYPQPADCSRGISNYDYQYLN